MSVSRSPASAEKYRAFICYSRGDRVAAARLHRRLETFRVPKNLVGGPGRYGPVPATLAPVFRDRDELSASPDIGERLREALAGAQFLVVLCSPEAAGSRWVNAEIEAFCAVRPGNRARVLVVLLAGEPGSGEVAKECLPRVLRGVAGTDALESALPLAADFRPHRERRRDAELRLVAALLGVEFDALRRREQERRVARLRLGLGVVATLASAFAALGVFAWQQRGTARQAAVRAATARTEAEKLVDFMITELRTKLELIGKLELLEPANERVRAYYGAVAPEEQDVEVLRRRAAAFQQYAADLRTHKRGAKTLPVLLTVAALRERLVQLTPGDAAAWQALAETRRYLGLQRRDDGDLAGALREFALAGEAYSRAVRLAPADFGAAARLASFRTDEADVLMRLGRTKEAVEHLEESLKVLEGLAGRDPASFEIRNRAAAAAWQLGNAFRRMGDHARAEAAYRRGADSLRELAGQNVFSLRWLANNEGGLGQLLLESGRNDEAVAVIQSAIATGRKLVAIDAANLTHTDALATQVSNLGQALHQAGRFDEALRSLRESIELREQAMAKGATDSRTRNNLALALAALSRTECELHHWDAAIAAARRGLELQQKVSAEAPADLRMRDDLGYMHAKLGRSLLQAKQPEAAIAEYRVALDIMDELLAKDPGNPQLPRQVERAAWLLALGTALHETGERVEAAKRLRDCLLTLERATKAGATEPTQTETRKEAEQRLAQIAGESH